MAESQISAFVSDETKEQIERFADAHGMRKGALVEQARSTTYAPFWSLCIRSGVIGSV